ncbi:hypothetical protein EW145_g45 [Phellinidium pouzarii]|uniref:acetyl-CoA C-acetyltransferase n=1 Tax=Phellinidium pouzarii TaxID=167371 RepID=A0A4S4LLR2_9AGAM|nr:hypothetical protein EW145_g45 [Phellinidium pouzarii]
MLTLRSSIPSSASSRTRLLLKHIHTMSSAPHEVVIVAASRTPVGSLNGTLKTVTAPQLGIVALKHALKTSGVSPADIEEVFMGNVVQAGVGQSPARQVALGAGLSESSDATTINKVCASGLKSIMIAAQSISSGYKSVVAAGGMESMSNAPFLLPRQNPVFGKLEAKDSVETDGLFDVYNNFAMGNCAEATAEKHNISREAQDSHAIESYKRAARAWAAGAFDTEIAPVTIKGKKGDTIVKEDEEYKKVIFEKIPSLSPTFKKNGGTVTAANSSNLNDGGSALILMSAEKAKELGVKPLAKIISYADAGLAPIDFPIAPTVALPKALASANLTVKDIALFEINEAFSVVVRAAEKIMGVEPEKINVNGGAVALGHAIGNSGSRIVVSLVHALKSGEYGAAGICNGGGAASALFSLALTAISKNYCMATLDSPSHLEDSVRLETGSSTEEKISSPVNEKHPETVSVVSVDSKDVDEALELVGMRRTREFTEEYNNKLRRKLGQDILELCKSDVNFNITGFFVWEFPTVYISQRLKLGKYLGVNVILWGIVLMLQAIPNTFGPIFFLRFILGMLESCVAPILILIISMFYKKNEQGISFDPNTKFAPYKILFLMLGGLAILVGTAVLIWMPDSPVHARILSKEERIAAIERVRDDQGGTENKRLKKAQVIEAFTDIRTWLIVISTLVTSIPNGGLSNFGAIILKSFGYTSKQALILGTPGGLIGAFATLSLVASQAAYKFNIFLHLDVIEVLPVESFISLVMEALQNAKGLTQEGLFHLSLDRSDKEALVKAFISSQRHFASTYLSEGKKEFAQWKEASTARQHGDSPAGKSAMKMLSVGGGFPSPVLKPRNAQAHLSPGLNSHRVNYNGSFASDLDNKQKVSTTTHQRGSRSRQPSGRKINQTQRKEDKLDTKRKLSKATEKNGKIHDKEIGPIRKCSGSSDEEREERLAQRRVRKRCKKAVIAPNLKTLSETAATDTEVEEMSRGSATLSKGKRKKSVVKKNSKNKLPAGLALMHGFNASNIGKHRLTVGYGATFGVFNKGRASAKTKVERRTKTKGPSVFSESAFLDKSFSSSKRHNSNPGPKRVFSDISDASTPLIGCKGSGAVDESKTVASAISCSSPRVSLLSSSQLARSSKQDPKLNYESEVWDIEQEFLPKAALSPSRCIVADSRAYKLNLQGTVHEGGNNNTLASTSLSASKSDIDFHEKHNSKPIDALHVDGTSSVAPSQSASQVPAKINSHAPHLSPRMKSKFFESRAVEKNEQRKMSSSPKNLPCHVQDSESHCQSNMSENMIQAQAYAICTKNDKSITSTWSLKGAIEELVAEEREPIISDKKLHIEPDGDWAAIGANSNEQMSCSDDVSISQSVLLEVFGKARYELEGDNSVHRNQTYVFYENISLIEEDHYEPNYRKDAIMGSNCEIYDNEAHMGPADFEHDMLPQDSTCNVIAEIDPDKYLNNCVTLGPGILESELGDEFLEDYDAEIDISVGDAISYGDGSSSDMEISIDAGPSWIMDPDVFSAPFSQGRALLLRSMDLNTQSTGNSESLAGCREHDNHVGSLEDIEFLVAKEFQRKWYPVKF